ncbi:MAG: hypothetical protein CM15mV12_3190 [uncultured marine virus]|nr:MAG: hypothetical protein CM15mV12_3190 [uncultured marine virus]
MINFEIIDQNTATAYDTGNINLRNGALNLVIKVGDQYEDDVISFYPPDKDMSVS